MMEMLEGLSHGLHLPVALPLMFVALIISFYYWTKKQVSETWLGQTLFLDIPGRNGDCGTVEEYKIHHMVSLWVRTMMALFGWNSEGYMDIAGNKWAIRITKWFGWLNYIRSGWVDTPQGHHDTLMSAFVNGLSVHANSHSWVDCADEGLQNCKKVQIIFIPWYGRGNVTQNRFIRVTEKDLLWIRQNPAEFATFDLGIWEFLRPVVLTMVEKEHLTRTYKAFRLKKPQPH